MPKSSFLSTVTPIAAANSPNKLTHAFKSVVQLLQCTIATLSPAGVVTISNSSCTFSNAFSKTTIANTEVPADTLPVLTPTEFVATIPVPASPSGGHIGIPASNSPLISNNFAPASVKTPADSPATKTLGKISRIFHGIVFTFSSSQNLSNIVAS